MRLTATSTHSRFRSASVLTAVAACACISAAAASDVEHLFALPDCGQSKSGKSSVYCSNAGDWNRTYARNLPIATRLKDSLLRPGLSSVRIASFYVADALLDLLIESYETLGAPVTIVTSPRSAQRIANILKARGKDSKDYRLGIRIHAIGAHGSNSEDADSDEGRGSSFAFHIKALLLEIDGGRQFELVFTSSNFGLGTEYKTTSDVNYNSANFENYQFVALEARSALVNKHQCLFDVLTEELTPVDQNNFGLLMASCLQRRPSGTNAHLSVLFLPAESVTAMGEIGYLIGSADVLKLGTYNAGDPCTLSLLSRAVARGVDVRLLTDKDGAQSGALPRKDREWFDAARKAGVQVRFIETGRFGTIKQIFHEKVMIAKARSTESVVLGSANLTCAAFRGNFESIYITEAPSSVYSVDSHFDSLWKLAATQEELDANR